MIDDWWTPERIAEARRDLKRGVNQYPCMGHYGPKRINTDSERGIEFSKPDRPMIFVKLFDYNCAKPWHTRQEMTITEAKEVAKWILKRVREEEPSLPRRVFNGVRNFIRRRDWE